MTSTAYKLGATCVAFNESGHVLITLRRSPERWELPGGLVEPGESLSAAAARETLEETTVAVDVHGLVGLYQHPNRGILAAVFIATMTSGTPRPTAEASEARWAEVPDALNALHPLYRPRLTDALAAKHTVPMRVHDGATMLSGLEVRSARP
ncbi:NUDIX hydrolase [Streptomyces niger]|uniref:NUDIX hydrolase n=1 Tax=Streptomyces niger TaxID=66373 RepID=UPI001F1FA200|nr:NUDIX hydrolase [Streptomyces niger]